MRFVFCCQVLSLNNLLTAQDTGGSKSSIHYIEQMPEYPGGEVALMNLIYQNLHYPDTERQNKIEGRVVVKFVVGADGLVKDVKILKSVSPGLDKEALRLVKLVKRFKPGYQFGKPVDVDYVIPIRFKLNEKGEPDISQRW